MKQCDVCRQRIEPAGHMTSSEQVSTTGEKPIVWLGACGCVRKQWVADDPSGEWRAYPNGFEAAKGRPSAATGEAS